MIASDQWLPGDGENCEGREGFTKGNEETFGVMGVFIVLMVVIDCWWVYANVKTDQIVYF